tara:strand:- start:3212 stop:3619 length:408 start_codon:yes stop_codon:yes gene_type:complete
MDSIKSAVMLLSEADILKIGDVRYDLFLLILLIISRELFCAAPKQEPNVMFLVNNGDDVPCGGKEGEEDVEHANEERVLLRVVVVVVVAVVVRAAKNLLARRSADGRAKGVGIGALLCIPFFKGFCRLKHSFHRP